MTAKLTDEELQDTVNAYHGNGSNATHTARALGIPRTTLLSRLGKAEERGITFQPLHSLPSGQALNGVSRYYKADGSPGGFWVKASKNQEAMKLAMIAAAEALSSEIVRADPVPEPIDINDDLMSAYVVTDYHLGQMAWQEETGAAWDIKLAEDLLVRWFRAAIKAAPNSKNALLVQLGDFLHTDGLLALTPTSGNLLDADARYQQIVQVCVRVLRRVIGMLLEKHEHVHIILAEGNHDLAGSVWMRAMFKALYENEPRVTVDNTHTPFYAYEWGQTSLFIHHGHKRRMDDLSAVFASMYRDMFGRTKYSYAHTGHLHHVASKEDNLMIVRQHPTLAAKDAHSARAGYSAQRSAAVITYSKQWGEVSEVTIRPEMVL